MNLFGISVPGPMALWRKKWARIPMIIIGLLMLAAAIWWGLPMTGVAMLSTIWFRATVLGVIFGLIALNYGLNYAKRRRAARELEENLMPAPVGDGAVLAERMSEALVKLKKAGGKTYLYDLPWYIIVGPPGAGKTTALKNSGIEFHGVDGSDEAGFGGTRNCDWFFAEDAVLIDTAGRYVTQDSDAEADKASWSAFLEQLKKGRPDQPINGVILSFSVEDLMNATPEQIAQHAETMRARLGEIHETLLIDFPVYVLFTKADLISGFREFFASFNVNRRKSVWGVTFQTGNRAEATHEQVSSEFDLLVSRLSDEVIDRMSEEPDSVARISIFGLPGQLALLKNNLDDLLRRVFEPTRYRTNAILRGFYFTSGTQEGTPIDQVLGAMSTDMEGSAEFQPSFMSGKGKSFFLHDLLKRVIFEERDWVSYDRKSVRRGLLLRTASLSLIAFVTAASMGAFAISFWQNATLVRNADADAARYYDVARNEIARTVIDDTDPSNVMPYLQDLRTMTAGYGDAAEPAWWEGFGLSRQREVNLAAERAYSDGLERMLRPRMVLHLENEIPSLIATGDTAGVYRALKVYLLLGGQQEGPGDPAAVDSYFEQVWRGQFSSAGQIDEREQLQAHLVAMQELDDDRVPMIEIDAEIVRKAREAIVTLPLAEQAYASMKDRAANSGIGDFNLVERLSGQVAQVFETSDGTSLDQLYVPALYTFEGYWSFFLTELTQARDRLREDQWVLGEAADRVGYDNQLSSLERDLHRAYRLEFRESWQNMLNQVRLAPMSNDPPEYDAMAAAASPVASPILELVEAVEEETRLSRLYEQIDQLSPEDVATGSLGDNLGDAVMFRIYNQSSVLQRVVLDSVTSGKSQNRAGNAVAEDTQRRQVELISDDFENWHVLLKGEVGARPIDLILASLRDVRENRRTAARSPTPMDETMLSQFLSALTANNTALPEPMANLLNEMEREFRAVAEDATMSDLNRALNEEVTQFCRDFIAPLYPFGNGRHVSPSVFGQFFGPNGRMDNFYVQYLQPHVVRTSSGLQPAPNSTIGSRLSRSALVQFERAQNIRLAFFASGSPEPQVDMSVSHTSSSPTVELSILTINGTSIRTQPNSTPAALSWPGAASGAAIELFPAQPGRNSTMNLADGRWDIVTFLRKGRARVNGNVVDVTHEIGGRSITYRMEFDSTTVPFLMSELADFSCPASLE